jgi:hypothetical protein
VFGVAGLFVDHEIVDRTEFFARSRDSTASNLMKLGR